MGTYHGGFHYAPYKPGIQNRLPAGSFEKPKASFENRFSGLVNDKVDSIEPDPFEMRALSNFSNSVRDDLNSDLSIDEVHFFGSSVDGTMINTKHKSDSDVMFVLNTKEHGKFLSDPEGPSESLSAFKSALEKDPKLLGTKITIDNNAVTISQYGKNVDAVPAFKNPDGRGFLIPQVNGEQKWIRTDPRTMRRIIDIKDKKHHGNVRKLIKLAKDYNIRNGIGVKPYHTEAMVIQYYENKSSSKDESLQSDVDGFFFRYPEYLSSNNIADPATGEKVGGYMNQKSRDRAIKLSSKSRSYVKKAREAKESGDEKSALDYYRRVIYD